MNFACQPGNTTCYNNNFQSSLSVFSLQDNSAHEIYQTPQLIIRKIDVATPQSYLFLAKNPTTGTDEIWSLHSDGSQPQKLASIVSHVQANQSDTFVFANLNISNDRSQYVIDNWPTGNNDETSIYYGSVQGGALQVIPDSIKAIAIGWALL